MASYECQRCHHMFQRIGNEEVCSTCAPLDEEEFRRIKEYISQHQGASSSEVVRALGVTINQIKRYLKEERLEIVGDNKGFLRCEKCGKPLNSGRLCDACYKEDLILSKKEYGFYNRNAGKTGSGGEQKDKHGYLKDITYKDKK